MKAETQSFLAFVAAGCFAAAVIGILVWKFSEATPRETVAGMQHTTSSSQSQLSYFSAPAPASTMPSAPGTTDLPPIIAALRGDPFLAPNAHISTGSANTPTRLYRPQPDNVSTTTAMTVVSTTVTNPGAPAQPEPTGSQTVAPQQPGNPTTSTLFDAPAAPNDNQAPAPQPQPPAPNPNPDQGGQPGQNDNNGNSEPSESVPNPPQSESPQPEPPQPEPPRV